MAHSSKMDIRNWSSINLSQTEPEVDAQAGRIYHCASQIPTLLNDYPQEKNVTTHIFRRTRLLNQTTMLEQSNTDQPAQSSRNNPHQQFYCKYHKFVKPYSQCTQYLDTLLKNRALLRRGAYDLPILPQDIATEYRREKVPKINFQTKEANKTETTQVQSRLFKKTSKQAQKLQYARQRRKANPNRGKLSLSTQHSQFGRTLGEHLQSYTQSLDTDKATQPGSHNNVTMQNSMNRVLAAQMINYHIRPGKPLRNSATLCA